MKAPEKDGGKGPVQRPWAIVYFLLVAALFLAVAALVPYWWAALPVLSLTGVVGWKAPYLLALPVGFLAGFGYWLVQLELLPAAPLQRLLVILGKVEGASPSTMLVVGPLLFGVLTALGALTVAGLLRFVQAPKSVGTDATPDAAAPA